MRDLRKKVEQYVISLGADEEERNNAVQAVRSYAKKIYRALERKKETIEKFIQGLNQGKPLTKYAIQRLRRAIKLLQQFDEYGTNTEEFKIYQKIISAYEPQKPAKKTSVSKKSTKPSAESKSQPSIDIFGEAAKEKPKKARKPTVKNAEKKEAPLEAELIGGDNHVTKIDLGQPLFPFKKIEQYITQKSQSYPLTVENDFLEHLNKQLYKCIQDVLDFVPIAAQSNNNIKKSKKNFQDCRSQVLGYETLRESILLIHNDIKWNEPIDDNIPQAKQETLVSAMKFYAYPMDKISKKAFDLMSWFLRWRIKHFLAQVMNLAKSKGRKVLKVCPPLSNGASVRAAQFATTLTANASSMEPESEENEEDSQEESGEEEGDENSDNDDDLVYFFQNF